MNQELISEIKFIINESSKRGCWKGKELTRVGKVYDSLHVPFVKENVKEENE